MGDESHIFQYEADGVSVLGGVGMHTVPTAPNGELPLEALTKAVRSATRRLRCMVTSHILQYALESVPICCHGAHHGQAVHELSFACCGIS